MVRHVDAQRMMPTVALAALVVPLLAAAGCGGGDKFANDQRPPAPITLSAAISGARVTVSPAHFGAGTVQLVASNQTTTSQRVTLRSKGARAGTAPPLEQSTGPINPGDTASLTADLAQGRYVVTARSASIDPAELLVGAPRPGGAAGLLQP